MREKVVKCTWVRLTWMHADRPKKKNNLDSMSYRSKVIGQNINVVIAAPPPGQPLPN